jgi:hypothetical protein
MERLKEGGRQLAAGGTAGIYAGNLNKKNI